MGEGGLCLLKENLPPDRGMNHLDSIHRGLLIRGGLTKIARKIPIYQIKVL